MVGKLLGLGSIGLTTVALWIGFAVGAALATNGAVADLLRPSVTSIDHPWIIAAMIAYFLAGYLVVSMIFLAIGALSDSMQDAQAYFTPMIMMIMLPNVLMMAAVIKDPDGFAPKVMSWIPIYTPFAMIARLGSGVSIFEVVGTGVLLSVFLGVEVVLLGRIFQASLLRTGQPPSPAGLLRLVASPEAN